MSEEFSAFTAVRQRSLLNVRFYDKENRQKMRRYWKWHLLIFWTIFSVLIYAIKWKGHRMKMIPISNAVNETHATVAMWMSNSGWSQHRSDVFNILPKPQSPCQFPKVLCIVLLLSPDLPPPCGAEEMAIPAENWKSNSPTNQSLQFLHPRKHTAGSQLFSCTWDAETKMLTGYSINSSAFSRSQKEKT